MNNNIFNNPNQVMNFNNNNFNLMNNNNMNNINNMNINNNINNMNFINNMNNMNLNFNVNNMLINNKKNINILNQINNMNNMNINNKMNNMKFNNLNMGFKNNMNNFNIMNNNNCNMIQNNINQFGINKIKVYFRMSDFQYEKQEPIEIEAFLYEKVSDLINKYRKISGDNSQTKKFIFLAKVLNPSLSLADAGIKDKSDIYVVETENILVVEIKGIKGAGSWFEKEINIKFIKVSKNILYNNNNKDIIGLSKLCLLKEVSQIIREDKLRKLPDLVYHIMEILLKGYISDNPNNIKKNIVDLLEKMEGSNIINFSNYVDEIIDSFQLNKILNLLDKKDLKKMNEIKYLLSKYNECIKLFNKEFIKAKKESIFEFSIISLVIIEREDYETFERERKKCPNRVDRILYHGTSIEPISYILTGLYRKSLENKKAINGKGVYFTDLFDYAWYYGGEKGNRANFSGIPKIGDTFTVIVNSIYYDRNGFQRVKNNSRTPGKNQINFAYAGARSERINDDFLDKSKFLGTEYVIYDLDQICPFMSAKLKRVEFCVIWRDDNFSLKPVYHNEYDQKFKSFLKERIKYINQNAAFNIYPCETSEEALELVKKKKYNKIILISNVGKDMLGKKFVEEARKIIGNDVIALFFAYKISHLDWIKNYKNALFSNEPNFYEDYLQCFDDHYGRYDIIDNVKVLIEKMENFYGVKFNFNDKFLDYPLFKNEGKYDELNF